MLFLVHCVCNFLTLLVCNISRKFYEAFRIDGQQLCDQGSKFCSGHRSGFAVPGVCCARCLLFKLVIEGGTEKVDQL